MKVTKRDAKLLILLAGLLVFLGLYTLVYTKTVEKTELVNARIAELRPEVDELEMHFLKLDAYQQSIADNRTQLLNAMRALPADVQEEDTLSYLLNLEKENGIYMQSVTFQQPTLYSQFDATIHQDGQDVVAPVSAWRHTTVMTGQMTYTQAKDVLDHLYESHYQTVLDSISLTYNVESGNLTASYALSKFSLDWPGGVYVPEPVPQVSLGVPQLFGVQADPNAPKTPEEAG